MARFAINFLRAYCLVASLLLLTIGGLAVISEQAADDSARSIAQPGKPR